VKQLRKDVNYLIQLLGNHVATASTLNSYVEKMEELEVPEIATQRSDEIQAEINSRGYD
jgi:uncharacterized protein (UPF0335 family)